MLLLLSIYTKFWGNTTNLLSPLFCSHTNYIYPQRLLNSVYNRVSKMTPPTIYKSVEKVLNVLKNHKADNVQAVNSLLEIYYKALHSYEEKQTSLYKKYPLIILEGLDGSGKSTVGHKLALRLNGRKWCTPPESIKPIRHLFDDHFELRTAYYALGNYIAALEVAVILKEQPVVMDRFWHSTAAFAIAQAVHDFPGEVSLPKASDPFYKWPSDLLKPDAVIFLDVREDVRLQRISRRTTNTSQEELLKNSEEFRGNIISVYKNMVDPKVTFVTSNGTFNTVLRAIDAEIKHLF